MDACEFPEATLRVADYLQSRRRPPANFTVHIDGHDVEAFFGKVDIGDFSDVEDIRLENRLALTFDPAHSESEGERPW
jgi:hypothetical protein